MHELLGRDAVMRSIQSLVASALPPTMSVEDAAALLGISRSMAYSEAARYRRTDGAEGIPNKAFGSRVVVLTAPFLDLLMVDDSPIGRSGPVSPNERTRNRVRIRR